MDDESVFGLLGAGDFEHRGIGWEMDGVHAADLRLRGREWTDVGLDRRNGLHTACFAFGVAGSAEGWAVEASRTGRRETRKRCYSTEAGKTG